MLSRARLSAVLLVLLLCVTGLYFLEGNSRIVLDGFSQAANKTGHYIKGGTSIFGLSTVKDEPPNFPPYGAVVAAARGDEDLSWMKDVIFQKKCVHSGVFQIVVHG